MEKKAVEKRFLLIFLLIQGIFAVLLFGLFILYTYLSEKRMATQITYQVESHIKNAPSRTNLEALSIAQSEHFNVIGYFNRENKNLFIFPASEKSSYFSQRSLLDRFLNGSIEVPIFFDEHKEYLVGTLKYIYSRFTFIPYVFLVWFLAFIGSIFLFRSYKKVWFSSVERDEMKERNVLISKIVGQVNHDLKSPLQTLYAVVDDDSDKIPSPMNRQSIHSAIDRIRGIMSDLKNYLKKNHEQKTSKKGSQSLPVESTEATSLLHFYSSLKQLFEEKRNSYKERNIETKIDFEPKTLKRASYINESDFLRTCSNVFLNSFEAVEKKFSGKAGGKIHISLKEREGNMVITFSDNGVGIPEGYIDEVQKEGFTYGKVKGTGLGLHYVFQKIKQWHGKTHIQSEVGKWTKFEIILPFDSSINLFESNIDLSHIEEILVLDDDPSVFDRWKRKLRSFAGKIEYLSHPHLPEDKITKIKEGKCLPLIDQEFRGDLETGLSFIVKARISKESFLVTNNYCKLDLLMEAKKRGIRIIPKPMIEDVVIS